MNRYQGSRYSFGYAACPDLELNRPLFNLLKPEEFGIELSETFLDSPRTVNFGTRCLSSPGNIL